MWTPRTICLRCDRPGDHCYCPYVPGLRAQCEVVFAQHPRERHVAINTAWMAHLGLAGSVFVRSLALDTHPVLAPLLAQEGVAVLFPGDGARSPTEWRAASLRTLVILDGTWWQARKLLRLNPRLAALPRMALAPAAPSRYRIRRSTELHHLSTVEAVVAALGELEGDAERFVPLLAPFHFMVERQLALAHTIGAARHVRPRVRGGAV